MRGKGSYAPFLPGGLEAAAIKDEEGDEEEDEEEEEDGWKTRAPGLRRGVKLDGAEDFLGRMLGDQGIGRAKRRKREGFEDSELEVSKLGTNEAWRGSKGVDDLLPIGRLPAPTIRKQLRTVKKEWAHVVDVNQELTNVSFPLWPR